MTTSQPDHEALYAHSATSRRLLLEGVALGVAYGILLRVVVANSSLNAWVGLHDRHGITGIMTWAFVVGGPFVIGFLCISRAARMVPVPWLLSIFAPWAAVAVMLLALALMFLEGTICVVMAAPIALVLASLGGLTAKVLRGSTPLSKSTLCGVALLPALLAPAESHLNAPIQLRTVCNEIHILAPASVVWRNIERVPAISPAELKPNWTHRIGFPRPVEATLSHEGVGGVRHASFEHGLLFIETITDWETERRLAFSIRADSATIPLTTLDEHVTIGGPYFDVLNGEYRLEPLEDGTVLLHLCSQQRLSTDFNGYAGLWTDAVMQNLQNSILEVIKHRCEHP